MRPFPVGSYAIKGRCTRLKEKPEGAVPDLKEVKTELEI